jgi:hypothetical protein
MGGKNRPVMVRFMKGVVQALRWLHENKEPAVEFLSREIQLKPIHARKGWEFYTQNRLWPPDGAVTFEGMKYNIRIYADQTGVRGPLPDPAKFVDQSYLYEAVRELTKQYHSFPVAFPFIRLEDGCYGAKSAKRRRPFSWRRWYAADLRNRSRNRQSKFLSN